MPAYDLFIYHAFQGKSGTEEEIKTGLETIQTKWRKRMLSVVSTGSPKVNHV